MKVSQNLLFLSALLTLIFGIAFRFVGLDTKLYWVDEAYSSIPISGLGSDQLNAKVEALPGPPIAFGEIRKLIPERPVSGPWATMSVLRREDPHHCPLYFVSANLWSQAFGLHPTSLRLYSALLSLLGVVGICWLCIELFPQPMIAWVAAALFSISPLQVIYAQQNREYALWTALTLMLSAVFCRALRKDTNSDWALYALLLAASFYTHLYSAFVFVVHIVMIAYCRRDRLLKFSITSALGLLAFAPWAVNVLTQIGKVEELNSWSTQPIATSNYLERFYLNFGRIFFDSGIEHGGMFFTHKAAIALIALIICFEFYSLYRLWRGTSGSRRMLLAGLGLIPVFTFLVADIALGRRLAIVSRYLMTSWPILYIAAAYLIWSLYHSKEVYLRRLAISLLLIFSAFGIVSETSYLKSRTWWTSGPPELARSAKFLESHGFPEVVMTEKPSLMYLYGLSYFVPENTTLWLLNQNSDLAVISKKDVLYLFKSRDWLKTALAKTHQIEAIEGTYLWRASRILSKP